MKELVTDKNVSMRALQVLFVFCFFFYINTDTKSSKRKIHTTVPRRHIFSPVGGKLKCLNT